MEVRKTKFEALLNNLQNNNSITNEWKYIGTGNPFANILIIGKESAVSVNSKQYKKEIEPNFNLWKNLENYDQHKIKEREWEELSVLYPYKGQFLKIDRNNNFGTSRTWMNYQKLINYVYNTPNNKLINFHENIFITEVNSTPSPKTAVANKDSISYRKMNILKSPFFQDFPIVIIAGVGYFEISENKNEIEEIFGVKFITKKFADKENNKQPYWIHYSQDNSKIVINTHQLSMAISNSLLEQVAKEIKKQVTKLN